MMEESGSVPLTNGSGPGRHKNTQKITSAAHEFFLWDARCEWPGTGDHLEDIVPCTCNKCNNGVSFSSSLRKK
jgi:hypothetical protein